MSASRITSALPALHSRNFRLLFGGQAVSVIGDALFPVALAFAVLDLGGSPGQLGLVLAAQGLPLAVLILFAGVWADRLPRQWIMFVSDVGRGLAQAVTAYLLLTHRAEIWHLALLSAVYGVFEAGFRPAAGGLIPQLVEAEHLQQANALIGLSFNFGTILGPVAAGLLIAASGPGDAIAVDAVTFAVSAAFLLFLRAPRPARATDPGGSSFWTELAAGIKEVRRRRWMTSFMPAMSAYHLIALPGVLALGPVIADRDLGGAGAWGIITSAFGIGTIVGNGVALRVQPSRPMLVASVATAIASTQPIIIAVGGTTAVIAVLELLAGIAVSFAFGQWETTLGREIPQHALARVTSLDYFTTAGVMPLGFALVGPVAGLAGTVPTMVVSGLLVLGLSLAAALTPAIRHLPRRTMAGGDGGGAADDRGAGGEGGSAAHESIAS
jgi:Major Facilitator Superfamily